jgi:hypothetical protein
MSTYVISRSAIDEIEIVRVVNGRQDLQLLFDKLNSSINMTFYSFST